ncbi:helix-turn-helix domain-containing protein [Yersinia intermedia]|uniref:winged helix-turn-helix domain-containing protein n=1 Tax=Yersinia intermedia TaxID=631 RepID=UPI0022FF1F90|nr:helix-turn-helix domain-containing protein [Yersinia intermedia]MDA5495691.1 helix-turn-helix domain-containing protein [Yersinia intermedia]
MWRFSLKSIDIRKGMRTDGAVSPSPPMMKSRDTEVSGFLVGEEVLVNVHHRVLQRLTHGVDRQSQAHTVRLGATEMRLLAYLLLHANGKVATYNKILTTVWVHAGLVPSYPRLCRVMQGVNSKLSQLGLSNTFIHTVRNQGCCIEGYVITPVYGDIKGPLFSVNTGRMDVEL